MDTSYLKEHRVKDLPGLPVIMAHLFPQRADNEAYLLEDLDITDLLKYLDEENAKHPDYKITVFHCMIYALTKMAYERPKMNRFIRGHKFYEREKVSHSFIVRRKFVDKSEESLMVLVPEMEDCLFDITKKIVGDVKEIRKSETSTGGIDKTLDTVAKLPHLFLMFFIRFVRWLDFWGLVPLGFRTGDTNYTTFLLSNLGSVKCPACYHHLNNYGTNSIMVTIGEMHKEMVLMDDMTQQVRDIVSIGVTIDERIGDGFYFAKSLKLVKQLFKNPKMFEEPISAPSGFEYK